MIEIKKILTSKSGGSGQANITYNVTTNTNNLHVAFSNDGMTINDNGTHYIGIAQAVNKPTSFSSYKWFKALPKVTEITQNYTISDTDDIIVINPPQPTTITLTTPNTPFDGRELRVIGNGDPYVLDGVTYRDNNTFIWFNGQWN